MSGDLPFLLRLMRVGLTACVAKRGSRDLTVRHVAILLMVERGATKSLRDIADTLDLTPSSATRLCNRLVDDGLLKRVRLEDVAASKDKRLVGFRQAPAGAVLIKRMSQAVARVTEATA